METEENASEFTPRPDEAEDSANNPTEKPKTRKRRPPGFWEALHKEFLAGGISKAELARRHDVTQALLDYHFTKLGMKSIQKEAFMDEAAQGGKEMAKRTNDKAKQWTEEQMERCYAFREKIDEQLDGVTSAKDVAFLSNAEEKTDKIARRTLGLEEKVKVSGSIDVHAVIGMAVKVFEDHTKQGLSPTVDANYELIDEDDQQAAQG